jgi:hypothetical protein
MVFVPSVSTFIISRLLGGGTNMLLGDLIEMQFSGKRLQPAPRRRDIAHNDDNRHGLHLHHEQVREGEEQAVIM